MGAITNTPVAIIDCMERNNSDLFITSDVAMILKLGWKETYCNVTYCISYRQEPFMGNPPPPSNPRFLVSQLIIIGNYTNCVF